MSKSSETLKLTSHETKDNEAWKHTARLYNTTLLEYNGQFSLMKMTSDGVALFSPEYKHWQRSQDLIDTC